MDTGINNTFFTEDIFKWSGEWFSYYLIKFGQSFVPCHSTYKVSKIQQQTTNGSDLGYLNTT